MDQVGENDRAQSKRALVEDLSRRVEKLEELLQEMNHMLLQR